MKQNKNKQRTTTRTQTRKKIPQNKTSKSTIHCVSVFFSISNPSL